MSIRFAGSRCVDERRRRRLAQEAEPESSPDRRPGPRARTAHRKDAEAPVQSRSSASPVESLLRPQLWFNVLLAVIGVCVSSGSIWLGWHVDAVRPALSASLGLENGLLGRAVVACHFLLAAQLGYVILWYRARSRKDFRGQYILWRWVEPTWLLLAAAVAIDGRLLIQELLLPQIPARIWHVETLCWMAPAAILVLTTTRFLLYDMREDRLGVAFVVLSGLGAGSAALTVLAGPLLAIDPRAIQVLQQASMNVWSLGALLSMLFHARYVIHVTNEAPKHEKAGRMAAFVRRLLPTMPRLRRAAAVDEADAETEQQEDSQESRGTRVEADRVAEIAKPSESQRRVDAAKGGPPNPPQAPEPERKPAPQDAPRTTSVEQVKATTVPSAAADEDDPEFSKGLSKKERRRLRKQRRQQQHPQQAQL